MTDNIYRNTCPRQPVLRGERRQNLARDQIKRKVCIRATWCNFHKGIFRFLGKHGSMAVLEASEIAVIRTTPFELNTRAIYLTGQWFTFDPVTVYNR